MTADTNYSSTPNLRIAHLITSLGTLSKACACNVVLCKQPVWYPLWAWCLTGWIYTLIPTSSGPSAVGHPCDTFVNLCKGGTSGHHGEMIRWSSSATQLWQWWYNVFQLGVAMYTMIIAVTSLGLTS